MRRIEYHCCARVAVSLLAAVATTRTTTAQTPGASESKTSTSPWRADAWVTGLVAKPFAASGPLSNWGYGASLGIGARRAPLPVSFGAEVAGVHWGTSDVPVVLRLGDTPTQAIVTIRQQTIFLNLWARAQVPRGLLRPYVELVGGLAMLDTEYTLRFARGAGATSVFDQDTTSASIFGLGLGLDVMLARADTDSNSGVLVTLGVRRLWGSRVVLDHATYGAFETDTDTVLISLGFAALGGAGRP